MKSNEVRCFITHRLLSRKEVHRGDEIKTEILNLIQQEHPEFSEKSYIDNKELNRFRRKYLEQMIASEDVALNALEQGVLDAVTKHKILSENIEVEIDKELGIGQRVADMIANFGGSWAFIGIFFAFILVWMALNLWALQAKSFDPYPFILLNLLLSCLAAIQAPIILMSQNRQEDKDRKRGEHDFQVNLKAELEIQLLTEKIDHIIMHQNRRLLEIQELQTDYLQEILEGHRQHRQK